MKEKRHISLRDKFIFSILVIGVLIIIVIGSFAYYTARVGLLDRTFDQLTSLRVIKKRQLESFFSDRSREIELLSSSEDVQEIIDILKKNDRIESTQEKTSKVFSKYLLKYLNSVQYYEKLYIISNDGYKMIVSSASDSSELIIKDADAFMKSVTESMEQSNDVKIFDLSEHHDHPAMFICCPVIRNNLEADAYIVLQLSLKPINNIMLENKPEQGLGESGESYLVGSDFLMRSNSRFQDNSVLNTRVETEAVLLALDDSAGTAVISDYRGIKVLSSFSRVNINDLQWVILAEIDLKEAMVPLSSIRNNILIISTFISLLLFIYTYIVSIRITSPIIKLKEATKSVGKGVFNQQLTRESNDEIGDLTESFNNMSNQLNSRTEELFRERRKGIRAVFDGQEIERQRLSRELHDGLGQSLIALKLKLEGLKNKDPEEIRNILEEIKLSFDDAIDEVRSMSNDLMPAVLNAFGLVKAIKNQCDNINNNSDVKVIFKSGGEIENLNSKFKTYLFRIIQEALNNCLKHASATKINIDIKESEGLITVRVQDDGKGFRYDDDVISKGNGLYNMRERVNLMNGNFSIDSEINSGTKIFIEIPFVH